MIDNRSNQLNNMKNEKESYLLKLISKIDLRLKRLEVLSKKFSNIRLFLFLTWLLVFGVYYFISSSPFLLTLLILIIIAFLIAVNLHNKVDQARKKTQLWREIKSTHLSKIRLEWKDIPAVDYGNEILDSIETDLNISGLHSLHQLVNIAVTKQGKDILRENLFIKDPFLDDILKRQKLVKGLIPLQRFRDKIQLFSLFPSKKELDGSLLLSWLESNNGESNDKKYLFWLGLLAPVNIILFALNYFLGLYPVWVFTLLIYASVYYFGNKKKNQTNSEFEFLKDELRKFGLIFEYLEKYTFMNDTQLKDFCSCYSNGEIKPSNLLNKISRANYALSIKKGNPFIWGILRIFYPIDFYYNNKLGRYKKIVSSNFKEWLFTFYELEALNSLANFAWLNPDYTFPEISADNNARFKALKIGHPFIQNSKKVCNDFSSEKVNEIDLITGSNMSGKSTFLRTIGINLCLAYAGAPVNAERLECSLFRIFTCIKVSDSVVDGISYFYAEVKRLKALLDEAKKSDALPLFFLIDEIFRGTNNIERLKGSTAFIKALSVLKVKGALATHDLELVKLESGINNIKNYHFKENIIEGKMVFDYKIQPGPCPTTNALKIMKLEGLPTEN